MKGNQIFYGIGVLLSKFRCLNSNPTTHFFPSGSNPKVSNDFICAGSYFSAHILEENVKKTCKEFPNASPNSRYPARLEETDIFGSISDSLITGLLSYKNNQYFKGHVGNSRVVIDMDCRFFGVVMYNKKTPIPCLELSYPVENSVTSPQLDYFEGYNCTGAVFSNEYVKLSLKIASEIKTRSAREYPREYILKNGRSTLAWPMFVNHNVYKPSLFFPRGSIFFLLLTERGQILGVIERSGDEELECQPIKVGLVPHITRLKSLHIPDTVDQENTVRYDCDGQIFRGHYVSKNLQMATDAYEHYRLTKFSRFNYPNKMLISSNDCPSGRWQWPLRNQSGAKKATKSISSNVLVFNRKFDFLGVYYVKRRKHIKCQKYSEQRPPDKASVRAFLDLNLPASCCLDCENDRGCCCAENWETST